MIHKVGTTYLCLYDHICISIYIRKRHTRVLVLGKFRERGATVAKVGNNCRIHGPHYTSLCIYTHVYTNSCLNIHLRVNLHVPQTPFVSLKSLQHTLHIIATPSTNHCNMHRAISQTPFVSLTSLQHIPQITALQHTPQITATHSISHCNMQPQVLCVVLHPRTPFREPPVTATYSSNHCTATHSFNQCNVLNRSLCHAASSALHHAKSTNFLCEPQVTATYSFNHCNALHKSLQHEITTLQHNH